MEDRELLELAAKACGLELRFRALTNMPGAEERPRIVHENGVTEKWNPLEDDGDAFRLMVRLSLRVEPYTAVKINDRYPLANITDVYSLNGQDVKLSERHGIDSCVATRRAIVRAAAEIGKSMP